MSFIITHIFSECIRIWYPSKTTNHILGTIPFGVGNSPLEKYCNLKNMHLWMLRQSNIVWTYSMHVALFWKSMVVLAESVVEFVQHPLNMSEIRLNKTLLFDSIDNISLSDNCLDEGWAHLTKGKSTHVKYKSNFPRMLLLHKKIFCHTGQYSVALW